MTFSNDIEKTEKEIAVLQKKLELLKEIEVHKSLPKMNLRDKGVFEVVSYNDEIYYRLEYPAAILWYRRKVSLTDTTDDVRLEQIFDLETLRFLEETIMIDGVKYQKIEEQKPQTLLEIIREWNDDDDNTPCEILVDMIESEWLPNDDPHDGEEYQLGWNACLEYLRKKLK